ncbi:MAG TPA: PASTA domain-containing protein [Gemmatimonadales bacterium]|nr:PASTA domain-containing protein [Gemmatimonadales bacterium]
MRFRRFTPEGNPQVSRRFLLGLAVVGGASLLGYLVAAAVLFPAPMNDATVEVPSVLGQSFTSATETLEAEGFRVRREAELPHPTARGGTVIWQDPPAAMRLPPSAVVRLTVSTGTEGTVIPDVVNLDVELAKLVLREAGFRAGGVDSVASLSTPGTVLATRPGLGVVRKPGELVTLVVSRGPADIQVPALRGLTRAQAEDRLEALGLLVGYVRTEDRPGARAGVVLEQRPNPGVRLPRRSRVDLTLARAP